MMDRKIRESTTKFLTRPHAPKIRPWIEIGSWPPLYYGKKEVAAQIQALSENNVDGWLLWQASGEYALEILP